MFKSKLKLESGNLKIQYDHQAAILKVTSLKINRLLPMITINMHMKFEIEIPKQTWLTLRKPCHLQSPETEKTNMAARRPFWKWRCWKSIGSYPYTRVLCRWSSKLIFKAKVKLESGNQIIQYGHQAAILNVTSLKINRLLPMATIKMYMKFEIEIPKQTWLMLRKPCRLQTDGRTNGRMDRRTDGQGESSIPPSNFVGRGYKKWRLIYEKLFEIIIGRETSRKITCLSLNTALWLLMP